MRAFVAAAVAASLAIAGPAEVRADTGNELFSHCAADENNHWEQGLCADAIQNVVETLRALKVNGREFSSLANYCPAQGVAEEQVMDAVTDWLRQNPQDRHYDASLLIMVALAEAWPCAE